LIIRQKEIYDGATPSGNSAAAYNLRRLERITMNPKYGDLASSVVKRFSGEINRAPSGFSVSLIADLFEKAEPYEIIVVGDPNADDTKAMIKTINSNYIPGKVVILRPDEEFSEIDNISGFVKGLSAIDGRATAYVCKNYSCSLPVNDIGKLENLLPVN